MVDCCQFGKSCSGYFVDVKTYICLAGDRCGRSRMSHGGFAVFLFTRRSGLGEMPDASASPGLPVLSFTPLDLVHKRCFINVVSGIHGFFSSFSG